MSLLLLQANAVNATADYLWAMQKAKDASDFKVVGQMAKDLIKMAGGIDSASKQGQKQELHIHLAKDLLSPTEQIVTSYEIVKELETITDSDGTYGVL